MILADELLKNNVAEYILYIYQMEDLIRAYNFDLEAIKKNVILKLNSENDNTDDYIDWFEKKINDLKLQGKTKSGHLNELEEIKMELFYLHNTLINVLNDEGYKKVFFEAKPYIKEFQQKSNSFDLNEIETCFNALYMKLLMILKRQEISVETTKAFDTFSKLITFLATSYHKMKRGDLNFIHN